MDSRTLRSAFLSAIPAQNIGVPEAKYLYIPKTHLRGAEGFAEVSGAGSAADPGVGEGGGGGVGEGDAGV